MCYIGNDAYIVEIVFNAIRRVEIITAHQCGEVKNTLKHVHGNVTNLEKHLLSWVQT